MPERTSHPAGVPSWIDIASPDVDASVAFYCGLFDWDYAPVPGPPEETGGYGGFALRGKAVAGIGPLQNPSQPAVWTTYVATDDADATAARVTEAGGQVALAPMDVVDAGRIAFFIDPAGAMFGVWQAKRHIGVELVNEPGTLGWNELACRDPERATAFYASIFGWEAESSPMPGGGGEYFVFNLDGHAVGGMIVMNEQWPESIAPHWMTYFVVADTDESAALAAELGGSAPVAPFDVAGVGRISVLADLNGTHFSIIALPGEPD